MKSWTIEELHQRLERLEKRVGVVEDCPAFRLTGDAKKLGELIVAIVTMHERIGWDRTFEQWHEGVVNTLAECMEKPR